MLSKHDKSLQIIYRLQDDSETGPFKEMCSLLKQHDKDYSYSTGHPAPCSDPKIGRSAKDFEYCACNSITQFRSWFSPHGLRNCLYSGYTILEITIPANAVTKGKFQVLYEPDSIISTRELSYPDIYPIDYK